jgi:hypothetical protein
MKQHELKRTYPACGLSPPIATARQEREIIAEQWSDAQSELADAS